MKYIEILFRLALVIVLAVTMYHVVTIQQEIYRLIEQQNTHSCMMLETVRRCYHYDSGHDAINAPHQLCPECWTVRKREGL